MIKVFSFHVRPNHDLITTQTDSMRLPDQLRYRSPLRLVQEACPLSYLTTTEPGGIDWGDESDGTNLNLMVIRAI